GRACGLRVAHDSVVLLRVDVVSARVERAPTVAADARAVLISMRFKVDEVRIRVRVGIEDDGRAEPHKRRDAETVMEAGSVHVRRGVVRRGCGNEPAEDVRHERAMPVAALRVAAYVWRAFEARVCQTRG